ncbi:MAG: hypothetical protein Q8S21_05560 [Candidatus Paracaedibacteraceae bacterium]|nr:hypothetical protein [Candidatus Paracaedibacteraceae bacterium]
MKQFDIDVPVVAAGLSNKHAYESKSLYIDNEIKKPLNKKVEIILIL